MRAEHKQNLLIAGLWIFSSALLYDVYHDLWEILHFTWYRVLQADMPDWLVCVRFVVSVTLRITLLWAVIGVLFRRENYRKLLVFICWFNICTVFLHHRYPSFIYISDYLKMNQTDFWIWVEWAGFKIYPGVFIRMLNAWANELVLAILSLAFFSRPDVKKLFR